MSTPPGLSLRESLHQVMFESTTPAGRRFDLVLFGAIFLSLVAVVLDSMESVSRRHHTALRPRLSLT